MASRKTTVHEDAGVTLTKVELLHDGGVAAVAYSLKSLRTPEQPGFDSLAEAEAAFAKEVELSRSSSLVAQRLG